MHSAFRTEAMRKSSHRRAIAGAGGQSGSQFWLPQGRDERIKQNSSNPEQGVLKMSQSEVQSCSVRRKSEPVEECDVQVPDGKGRQSWEAGGAHKNQHGSDHGRAFSSPVSW